MEPIHEDYAAAGIRNQTAQEQQEFNLFATLKPTLQRDGNQWCVLYGADLQSGIAGFGSSPYLAIMDFNVSWYKEIEGSRKSENIYVNVAHGVDCKKELHGSAGGYLHSEEDDTPYDVDGCLYCGRCHKAI